MWGLFVSHERGDEDKGRRNRPFFPGRRAVFGARAALDLGGARLEFTKRDPEIEKWKSHRAANGDLGDVDKTMRLRAPSLS
jgi:hypothetical protein